MQLLNSIACLVLLALTTVVEASAISQTYKTLSIASTWTPPLNTRGRYVVDANGKRFRLKGGNWHGASGTYLGSGNYSDPVNHHAGELAYQTPLCLDRAPIAQIINSFLELGINTIRLPWSNEMIHTTTKVPDSAMTANPQFKGMTPLQIFDACIKAMTDAGLAVILNNHVVKSLWCCGLDVNSRWNGQQSTQTWENDWVFMINRYKSNLRVVGADLYNEVRRDLLTDPTWGDGQSQDWYQASFDAGTRIHKEASSNVLIIVEGINFVGIPVNGLPHYRPELQPVARLSHALPYPDKLVYQSHFYAYTGANQTGGSTTSDPSYGQLSRADLLKTFNFLAGYVATPLNKTQQHYTAPVWIGEFGSAGRTDTSSVDRSWWTNFINILIDGDYDYAYWPLVGWQEKGVGDGWAFNQWDHLGNRINVMNPTGDWRLPAFSSLQNSTKALSGIVARTPIFRMLFADNGNAQQSVAAPTSWAPSGNTAAVCPDGLRLLGLSYRSHPRALCGNPTFGNIAVASGSNAYTTVTDEKYVPKGNDWAYGYTKLQCPAGSFLIGHSFSYFQSTAALCAKASSDLSGGKSVGNRTLHFGGNGNQGTQTHGDFSPGDAKGVCGDDELAVGFAFSESNPLKGGWPAYLLCQNYGGTASVVAQNSSPGKQANTLNALYLSLAIALFLHQA